jgi:hypothetical protein
MGPYRGERGIPTNVERISAVPRFREVLAQGRAEITDVEHLQAALLNSVIQKHSPLPDNDNTQLAMYDPRRKGAIQGEIHDNAVSMTFTSPQGQTNEYIYPLIALSAPSVSSQIFLPNANGNIFPSAFEKRQNSQFKSYVSDIGISLESCTDNEEQVYLMFGGQTRDLALERETDRIKIYTEEAFSYDPNPHGETKKRRWRPEKKMITYAPNATQLILPDMSTVTLTYHKESPLRKLQNDLRSLSYAERDEYISEDTMRAGDTFAKEVRKWIPLYHQSIQPAATGATTRLRLKE